MSNQAGLRRITNTADLPPGLRGCVLAIGNFDGVHRGHQEVLGEAIKRAQEMGVPAVVLTFDPHPRKVFRPDLPHCVLTPLHLKAELLAMLGFDAVIEQPFNRELAALSAETFVSRNLVEDLAVSHVVTGFDFHFGKGRQGSPEFLMQAGEAHGFGVTLVEAFCDEGSDVISSSRIRALLAEGQTSEANGLLGYGFTVEAPIIHGRQLGRTLGFPTANMELPPDTDLRHGVYAVRLRRALAGSLHNGVASFGLRPTVATNGLPLLETFVFDFSGDLYGEVCRVSLFGFLRGEEKFASLEDLAVQMERDEEEARALLAGA